MKTPRTVVRSLVLVGLTALLPFACSSEPTDTPGSGGGHVTASGGSGAGGTSASGGTIASGGKTTETGGSGGASSGGTTSSGGQASGGISGTGGKSGVGGRLGTGGKPETGGAGETGGAASGGTTGGPGTGGANGRGGATGSGGSKPDAAIPPIDSGAEGGSSGSCPATVMKPGDSTQKVGSRSYILHVPTGYTGTKPVPLVIDFHALGGTGSQQKGLSGWDKKGDKEGFLSAFPDSASNGGNGWNVGMCCQDAQKNKVDDVGFVRDMIKAIEGMACVDSKRIFVSGCSNGGGMSYKTACDVADLVAAAAPVDFRCVYGGTTASPSCDGCKPARPISIIHFDNTGDTSLVPFGGGMTSFAADCPPNSSCTGMGFPSNEANFTTWQKLDGCTGTPAADSAHSSCKAVTSCSGGTEVANCVQQGGSHCGNYGTLKIVDTAWDYFKNLAIP